MPRSIIRRAKELATRPRRGGGGGRTDGETADDDNGRGGGTEGESDQDEDEEEEEVRRRNYLGLFNRLRAIAQVVIYCKLTVSLRQRLPGAYLFLPMQDESRQGPDLAEQLLELRGRFLPGEGEEQEEYETIQSGGGGQEEMETD